MITRFISQNLPLLPHPTEETNTTIWISLQNSNGVIASPQLLLLGTGSDISISINYSSNTGVVWVGRFLQTGTYIIKNRLGQRIDEVYANNTTDYYTIVWNKASTVSGDYYTISN